MKIDKEIANQLELLAHEMLISMRRGDERSFKLARSEYYNYIASIAKKQDDNIPIYLMALVEETEKKNFYYSPNYIHGLLTLYLVGEGLLEAYCHDSLPYMKESAIIVKQEMAERRLTKQFENFSDKF